MLIKPEQQLSEPLKFVFHLTKFRCKMLKENKVSYQYIYNVYSYICYTLYLITTNNK